MQKQLPKYHETFIPILKVLSDGQTISTSELRKKVKDRFYNDVEPALLELKTKGGQQLLLNRIGWGKAYLKQAEMISQPSRALVQITDKGRQILEKGSLTLKELLSDHDFIVNRKVGKEERETEEATSESSPQDLIDLGFRSIEGQVKIDLLTRLKKLDPYYFQRVILLLLQKMGYGDFEETSKGADGGIDGIISQDKLGVERIYMQAKRYADGQVGGKEMTNFIGAITRDRVKKGIFVTTSTFGTQALENAKNAGNVVLVDGERLVELMLEYNVGIQIKSTYEVKEIDEDFFEEE